MGTSSMDVGAVIDRSPVRPVQYWTFAACLLVSILDGFDQAVVAVAGPMLISQGLADVQTFGLIVSAGIVGFVPGALLLGSAADRWGRRSILILAVCIISVGSLLTALSTSLGALIVCRIFTGIGLGGAAPCFVNLAAEYAPRRLRITVVTLMWAGIPLGGILSGVVASLLITGDDWPTLFLIAAAAPLPVLVMLCLLVPESVGHLVLRGDGSGRARTILSRIATPGSIPENAVLHVQRDDVQKVAVRALFGEGRTRLTVLLWTAFFLAFVQLTMVSQYSAVLLRSADMPAPDVKIIFSLFYAGSVIGTVMAGPVLNRMPHARATALLLVLTAISTAAFSMMTGQATLAMVGMTAVGVTQAAAVGALIALTTELYPLGLRSTGFGWGIGVSRMGAALGPICSAFLLGRGIGPAAYYATTSIIALLAALTVMWMVRMPANLQPR